MKLVPETNSLPRLVAFPYLIIAVLAGLVLYLRPDAITLIQPCPMRHVFDLACPTCGGLTAAVALVNLDFGTALRANPLATIGCLLLFIWVGWAIVTTVVRRWRRQIVLSAGEKRILQVSAIVATVAVWMYEIVRLHN